MTRQLLSIFVILAMLALPNLESANAEESENYRGAEVRRWSAVVSDLDETIHLYTDILGFELGDVTTDPKTSYVYEIFNISRDITTRHATFHAGKNKRVLSVIEVPVGALPTPPQDPRLSVTLLNANGRFDEIFTRLTQEGYTTMKPHALGSQGIEVGFMDKDGHLYALYEYPYAGDVDIKSQDDAANRDLFRPPITLGSR